MQLTTEDRLIGEVAGWLSAHFSAKMLSVERIRRGLLNEKWIVETSKGRLFVKCYHPERYAMHTADFRSKIENALQLQLFFNQAGGACPEPLVSEGRCMHLLPCGRYMTVMTCCPGAMVPAGMISEQRMHALGRAAAHMHAVWDSAEASGVGPAVPTEEPLWQLSRAEMERAWEACWNTAGDASEGVRYALRLQKAIIDSLGDDVLAPPKPGWTHLDLWADNLLFQGEGLAAIVDFDRVRHSFPTLDLGRAILSGALDKHGFRKDAAIAFAEGYRSTRPLPQGSLMKAIKYVWCVESFWWIRPSLESFSAAPARFAEEMIHTAERWEQLDILFRDI